MNPVRNTKQNLNKRAYLKRLISNGVNFREKVLKIVQKIPRGKTLTYKGVAKLAGSPRAWRTVGNILNKNRDSKIPCYRVIRSDGKVGNYNRGKNKKIALLKREGIKIKGERVIS